MKTEADRGKIKDAEMPKTSSVGVMKMTPSEPQTVLFEVANLSNNRPIGINKCLEANGWFRVMTPNDQILGRSQHKLPDATNLANHLTHSKRYQLIQQITFEFWSRSCKEVTPQSVIRQK